MNCPNCGTSNLDNASICVNCGRPLHAAPPPPPGSYTPPPPPPPPRASFGAPPPYAGGPIPNYLGQAIVITLCCCMPFGIVAIIFAAQVNSKQAQGDYAGALAASANARRWCWIGFATWLAMFVLWIFLYGSAAFLEFRKGWNSERDRRRGAVGRLHVPAGDVAVLSALRVPRADGA